MQDAPYPGELASPREVLRLAEQFRHAAKALEPTGRRGDALSRAPYRLAAIHAVELYLNALLQTSGHPPATIRKLRHDFAQRADLALAGGLVLRQRTREHLRGLSSSREYLVARYGPEMTAPLSHLNRLAATLDEVASKTTALVEKTANPV